MLCSSPAERWSPPRSRLTLRARGSPPSSPPPSTTASAPAPPSGVKIEGAVSPDTKVSWTATPGAAGHRVWWRGTTDPTWRFSRWVPAGLETPNAVILKDVVIDDFFFGVSAVSADGWESPVVFPGAAGSFESAAPAAKP